jgi:3-phenylpropionate/trans-cinnamate dioxygenase ferredoxin reductase subunit
MLGRPVAYDRLPNFYSDQYDIGMEYSGLATLADGVVFRGDPASRQVVAF